jgi:hypothetical protein
VNDDCRIDRKQSGHGSSGRVKGRMNGSNVFARGLVIFHRRTPISKLKN